MKKKKGYHSGGNAVHPVAYQERSAPRLTQVAQPTRTAVQGAVFPQQGSNPYLTNTSGVLGRPMQIPTRLRPDPFAVTGGVSGVAPTTTVPRPRPTPRPKLPSRPRNPRMPTRGPRVGSDTPRPRPMPRRGPRVGGATPRPRNPFGINPRIRSGTMEAFRRSQSRRRNANRRTR